jgi:hypothetical protein
MTSFVRKSIVTLFAGASMVGVTAGPASAANQNQDGLVNVAVGDITIQDINVGVAAQVAAQVCGLKVGPVAVLGRAVDLSGQTQTICRSPQGPVTISQN